MQLSSYQTIHDLQKYNNKKKLMFLIIQLRNKLNNYFIDTCSQLLDEILKDKIT